MPDLYTLFAKIQSLPKRRIAEVEDFVDFLTLRRAGKSAKPPLDLDDGALRDRQMGETRQASDLTLGN